MTVVVVLLVIVLAVINTVVTTVTAGALNRPLLETVPAVADQETARLWLPLTVAVNCWTPRDERVVLDGEIVTAFLVLSTLATGNVAPPQATRIRVKARGRLRSVHIPPSMPGA